MARRPRRHTPHPTLKRPVSRELIEAELYDLWVRSGLQGGYLLAWTPQLDLAHRRSSRRYAQVLIDTPPRFEFAPQMVWLPKPIRIGLLAHEVGHVLRPGTEPDADDAAEEVLGIGIAYDMRWPGKGLQTAVAPRRNPMYRYNPDACDSGIRFHDGFCSPRGELETQPDDEWLRGCREKAAVAVGRDLGHFTAGDLAGEVSGCGESSMRKILKQMQGMGVVESWEEMRGLDKTGRRIYELSAPGMDLADWVSYRQDGGLESWEGVEVGGGDTDFDPSSFGAPEEIDLNDWSAREGEEIAPEVTYEVVVSTQPEWEPSRVLARHPNELYPVGIAEVYHSGSAVWDERAFGGLGPQQYAPLGCVRVHPGYRRLGIATALVQQAASLASDLGIPLASSDSRTPGMAKFWAKQIKAKTASKKRHRSKKHPEGARYVMGYPPQTLANPSWNVRSARQGLNAIQHPDITKNYRAALRFKPKHKLAVLLPCAQTKPFTSAPSYTGGYLQALEGKAADLWVVSEPLGVVPLSWAEKYPNYDYDFPPRYLTGEAREALTDRVAQWFKTVGAKYDKVVIALPGHHARLAEDALDLLGYAPTSLSWAGIGDCLDNGACPPGHYRATSKSYKKYLRGRVRSNPQQVEAQCPTCGELASWSQVEATPTGTAVVYQCPLGHRFSAQEPAHPPEFFQTNPRKLSGPQRRMLAEVERQGYSEPPWGYPGAGTGASAWWRTAQSLGKAGLVSLGGNRAYSPVEGARRGRERQLRDLPRASLRAMGREAGLGGVSRMTVPELAKALSPTPNPYQEWWRQLAPGVEGEAARQNPCWPCLLL